MQSHELHVCHCIVVVSVNESVSTEGLSQDTLLRGGCRILERVVLK